MAISRVAESTLASGLRTNTTVTVPAGTTVGHMVFVTLFTGGPSAISPTDGSGLWTLDKTVTYTAPDPWAVVMQVWRKPFVSGETTYMFTHASSTTEAFTETWSGVDTTNPMSGTSVSNFQNNLGGAGSPPTVSMTTAVANSQVLLRRGSWDGNPISPPAGYTERKDGLLWAGDALQAAAGATGTVTIPSGNAAVDNHSPWGAIIMALRPGSTTIQAVPMIARGGMIPPTIPVDTTIAAVPMIARGGMQVLGATISVTIDAVPMIARGVFLPQTPTTVTDTTIAAVPMIARGVVIPPSVNVSIAAVPMIARGVFIPPSVAVDVTVQLVPMIARAVFIPPSVNVDTVVPAVPMIARGGMIAPRVTVDVTIQAVPMIARGVFIPPSVIADITILAVPFIARGFFLAPRVTGAPNARARPLIRVQVHSGDPRAGSAVPEPRQSPVEATPPPGTDPPQLTHFPDTVLMTEKAPLQPGSGRGLEGRFLSCWPPTGLTPAGLTRPAARAPAEAAEARSRGRSRSRGAPREPAALQGQRAWPGTEPRPAPSPTRASSVTSS
jgi:hypothetical protein